MKASLVSESVCFLEKGGYIRSWTERARRDKLYAISSRGLHLAFLVYELAELNGLTDIINASGGGQIA